MAFADSSCVQHQVGVDGDHFVESIDLCPGAAFRPICRGDAWHGSGRRDNAGWHAARVLMSRGIWQQKFRGGRPRSLAEARAPRLLSKADQPHRTPKNFRSAFRGPDFASASSSTNLGIPGTSKKSFRYVNSFCPGFFVMCNLTVPLLLGPST